MYQSPPTVLKLAVALVLCIGIADVAKSWHYTKLYTGSDLECRIRGARLQQAGYNAYIVAAKDTATTQITGATVPPGMLLLHQPLLSLPYHSIRTVWFTVQYLLLLGAVLLLAHCMPVKGHRRLLMVTAVTVLFISAGLWQLHTERGQLYVLYVFLFALMYFLCHKNSRWSHFASGIVAAFMVWARILFAVAALPFLLQKNKLFITGFLSGLAVLALLSLPAAGQWQDYFSAMGNYTGSFDVHISHHPVAIAGQFPSGAVLPVTFKPDFVTGCINYLDEYLRLLHTSLPQHFYLALYAVAVLVLLALKRKQLATFSTLQTFILAFLLYTGLEYSVAASRNPYNLIQWLFPVMLLAPAVKPNSVTFFLLAAGLCLLCGLPLYFPYCFELGEVMLLTAAVRSLSKNRFTMETH